MSLRTVLKHLRHKGELNENQYNRIVDAIEREIPKKHKIVDNVLYCSACESYHGRYGDISIPVGSDFCPYCGQAIDWSDEE